MARFQHAVTQAIRIDLPIDVGRSKSQLRKANDKSRKRGQSISIPSAQTGDSIIESVAIAAPVAAPKAAPATEPVQKPTGLALRLFPNGL